MRRGCRWVLPALLTSVAAVLSTVGVAGATWAPASTGIGFAAARSVGVPVSPSASAPTSSTVDVTWSPPGGTSAAPTQYVVKRTAPSGATVCTVGGTTFVCHDVGLSARTTYTYTVEARVGGWSSGTTIGVSATTPAPPAFTVAPAAGPVIAGTAFDVVLTATTNGVTTDTSYTGAHAVTFTGPAASPSGSTPTYPATVTFVAGIGTASMTLVDADATSITATEGTRTGSAPVTVAAGASTQLVFTTSSPSCDSGTVAVGTFGTFTSKVSMEDPYGNLVPQGAAISVTVARSPVQGSLSPTSVSIAKNASESSTGFTFRRPLLGSSPITVTAARSGLTSASCSVEH